MEQKKKRGRKVKILSSDSIAVQKDGIVEGNYSKALWNNGELVSFDIDWDKLAEHMKKVS